MSLLALPDPEPLKITLTELRLLLNRLNTLNCVVHQYMGNFEVDPDKAKRETEAAYALYREHLQAVDLIFVQLGRMLIARLKPDGWNGDMGDIYYSSAARRWYQKEYETGVLW